LTTSKKSKTKIATILENCTWGADGEIWTAGAHRIKIVLLQDLFCKSWKKTAKIAKIRTHKKFSGTW